MTVTPRPVVPAVDEPARVLGMKAATRADRRARRLDERRSERRARARGTTTRPHSSLALLTVGGILGGVLLVGAILALGNTGPGATSVDLRAPAVEYRRRSS